MFFIFSAGRVWYTITPPMVEIEKFCFRPSSSFSIAMTARLKRKKSLTKFFHFFCWEGLVHHNSVHGWGRKVLFSAFVIVFYSDDSQTKTKKKIFDQNFFIFFCWEGLVHHNSAHGWDRKVLFLAFVIVFYSNDSQTKTKKIFDNFFFIFSAGRVWYTITPPMGEIIKFCFRPSSSFSIAMTARLKWKKSLTKSFSFFLLGGFGTP